jgi:hypothetical protein
VHFYFLLLFFFSMSDSVEIQESPSSPVSPAFSPTKPSLVADTDTPDTQTEPESNAVYETPNLEGVKKRLFSSQDEDEAEDEEDEDEDEDEEEEKTVTVIEERAQQIIEDITEEITSESARNNYDVNYISEENSFCITGPEFTINMAESLLQKLNSAPEFTRLHPTQMTRAVGSIAKFLEASYELRDTAFQVDQFISEKMSGMKPQFQFGSGHSQKRRNTSNTPK